MLEVAGLAAGYGALPVLRGIDFTIAEGEIVAVLAAMARASRRSTTCSPV
jgi:branched-chain amino acid transport system ATP-binding protein